MNLPPLPPPVLATMPWGDSLWVIPGDIICQTMLGPQGDSDVRAGISPARANGNFWDGELLLPIFDEVLKRPNPGVVNIGAFIGHEAAYLSNRGAHVLAVEPNPDLYALAARNTARGSVILLHAAAYDSRQEYLRFSPQIREGHSVGSLAWIPSDEGVPSVVLDDFVSHIGHIDLIECDAQGADLRAIAGLSNTILNNYPIIVFEFEEDLALLHGNTWEHYEKFFTGWPLNYSLEESKTHSGNFIARKR